MGGDVPSIILCFIKFSENVNSVGAAGTMAACGTAPIWERIYICANQWKTVEFIAA